MKDKNKLFYPICFIDSPVSMHYMECLLSNCFYLKYLELHIQGSKDLMDGHRWQILTNSLITFNFKFHAYLYGVKIIPDSFRTSFWLEEKHWFVAYQNNCLYSVPYFAMKEISTSQQPSIHCTASDKTIIYGNVTKLVVTSSQTFIRRFTRVSMLELKYDISQTALLRFIDPHHITHLSIIFLSDLLQFPSLNELMFCLKRLSVKNQIRVEEVKLMINDTYEQIRTLEIIIINKNKNDIIEELSRLFPYTEQLIYKSDIQTIDTMVHLIDGFKSLQNASFSSCDLLDYHHSFLHDSDLIIFRTKRLIPGLTMCRSYHVPPHSSIGCIDWWIEN